MSSGPVLLLMVCLSASFVVVAVATWLLINQDNAKSGGNTGDKTPVAPASSALVPLQGGSGWKKATATHYDSYPKCCPDSPTYDKNADKSECDDYSGCRWMGMFSGFPEKKSLAWVKNTNIASFFEVGQTASSWNSKWKNKRLQIRNPKTGKGMDVLVVDRCDDDDCGGCCTKNAKKNGGTLIDLEWHTAQRFWGSDKVEGLAPIDWKCLNC